jgi:hypothetical protein
VRHADAVKLSLDELSAISCAFQQSADGQIIHFSRSHFHLASFDSLTVNWIAVRIGAMTMIYVKAPRGAFDRARDGIAEPHVFDNVNNPRVAAACAALIDAAVAMLFARANTYAVEGSFFRMLSAHRVVYRTGKAAAEALGTLDVTIRDAWIAAGGNYISYAEAKIAELTQLIEGD